MYAIVMPGRMHRALDLLGVFEEGVSQEAVEAFRAAVHRPYGRGTQATVTGSQRAVRGVLDVLRRMVDEADDGTVSVNSLGHDMCRLRTVSRQPMRRVV